MNIMQYNNNYYYYCHLYYSRSSIRRTSHQYYRVLLELACLVCVHVGGGCGRRLNDLRVAIHEVQHVDQQEESVAPPSGGSCCYYRQQRC